MDRMFHINSSHAAVRPFGKHGNIIMEWECVIRARQK